MAGYATLGTNDMECRARSTDELRVESPEAVKAVYDRALALGGTDEAPPGPRGGFHGGYLRDLDGSKLDASCLGVG